MRKQIAELIGHDWQQQYLPAEPLAQTFLQNIYDSDDRLNEYILRVYRQDQGCVCFESGRQAMLENSLLLNLRLVMH